MSGQDIVQVQLRTSGEMKYYLTGGMKFDLEDKVIVEADRGLEDGEVVAVDIKDLDTRTLEKPLRKVIRKANPWDAKQIAKNKSKTKDLMKVCEQKIQELKLPMKLVDAEYTFDRSKILFYFTSENRVDFRNLVKNLASIFRVRIELRQIGVRDEARLLGGHGPCGRKLCCMSFMKDFDPVTIKMAKVQNLPLKPSKISGLCGRLMCCLGYEYKHYQECCRGLPRVGKDIKTEHGKGKVIAVNPLKRTVTVSLEDGRTENVKVEDIKEKVIEKVEKVIGKKESKDRG
ncbi:MAG: stage 0 sporulation family protein [Candidatus Omnitrophica bacterium]|nr:stage 0 sporulation family protein [Candidatus Omnitrophota bacterium]